MRLFHSLGSLPFCAIAAASRVSFIPSVAIASSIGPGLYLKIVISRNSFLDRISDLLIEDVNKLLTSSVTGSKIYPYWLE